MSEMIAKEYIELISNLFGNFSQLNKEAVALSHLQSHVLEFIYMKQRALNIKDISSGLDIAKQQLTKVISDLETGGFLVKAPDPKDKRAVLVSLTTAGKDAEDQKWAGMYQRLSNNLTKLTDEEQADLTYALHKVNLLLKKMEN
ncbi:transcriptional regulator, MarR family [Desulfitobacterium hafniense DCB-2]|uniref:Transcriptional regulator, MarR family n=1 Tax=Desulfitobacterium hafniense (strain DSM 10664 / DCB-2) TaxID=272564 RepID=B8FW56_DESHD|nr:winged helix DNA-binding protein [Desulfitobacterium hafniense]ACL20668.1 transcriptional regulator, MarR family [Desulfitobacterium hafniense DCB-2]